MTSAATGPLVRVSGLEVTEGRRRLLHDVSLDVRPGEIVTVVGPNGAGKTTLLRALIGAIRPSAGWIERARGLRIGYTPQKLQIERAVPLTVERFLALGGRRTAEARRAALARVGIAALRRAQFADLSGGELQRALLARALLRRPNLLILDEPTQGLDQPGAAAFYRLIGEIRDETGAGVLLVSHDLHVVMRAADRVICLNGHVCCAGAPQAVSADPAYRRLFGAPEADALAVYRHEHDHSHEHNPGERAAS